MAVSIWYMLASIMFSINTENNSEITAKAVSEKVIIDGDLSDWPSGLEQVIVKDRIMDQGGKERILSDNKFTCSSLWNDEFLFLGFRVQDEDLRAFQKAHDHKKLYLDDMVEFLLDPRLDATDLWLQDDFIYHINLYEAVKDDRGTSTGGQDVDWNGQANYALMLHGTLNDESDRDRGYNLEVAIPWAEIGVEPKPGLKLGFNFANGDNDGKGRQLYDWMGAWPIRTPSQFGAIILAGN